MKIARVERKFDECIMKWLSGMDRFHYSLEARKKVWVDIQTEWVEWIEQAYKFGLIDRCDMSIVKHHVVYVTNKLIGDLVETSYDMSKDIEMSRIYPYIGEDWKRFIGWR